MLLRIVTVPIPDIDYRYRYRYYQYHYRVLLPLLSVHVLLYQCIEGARYLFTCCRCHIDGMLVTVPISIIYIYYQYYWIAHSRSTL